MKTATDLQMPCNSTATQATPPAGKQQLLNKALELLNTLQVELVDLIGVEEMPEDSGINRAKTASTELIATLEQITA